ncbi:MAG TPA: hypothetical protein VIW46_01055 [Acidimicrobiia bacterium]
MGIRRAYPWHRWWTHSLLRLGVGVHRFGLFTTIARIVVTVSEPEIETLWPRTRVEPVV